MPRFYERAERGQRLTKGLDNIPIDKRYETDPDLERNMSNIDERNEPDPGLRKDRKGSAVDERIGHYPD